MNSHSTASDNSKALCDELFAALGELIPNLQRNSTKGSCGIWQAGKTRFAYVYHSKTQSQVEVWCRGEVNKLLANDPGLNVRARDNPRPGWEESFPARFRVYQSQQIPKAAEYLKRVSYIASSPK
jgi:hypothetical protein